MVKLYPVVGDAQKYARLQIRRFNKVALMQPLQLRLRHSGNIPRVAPHGLRA